MLKAIIFDFDGTVADSLPICIHAFKSVFKEFDQKDYTTEDIIGMFGPPEAALISNNLLSDKKEEAVERYYEIYVKEHNQWVDNNEEIKNMLKQLRKQGYLLGLVTGKSRRGLDYSLKALGMDQLFDVELAGDEVAQPKPHSEGVQKALDLLGVKNTEAVYIGDSDFDIQAARGAGVSSIGVHWLPNVQSPEFKVKPDHYFRNVGDFENYIQAS
ncbi:MAG: HAD family hydrolase [Bacillus sp. (in: firmicutes)]